MLSTNREHFPSRLPHLLCRAWETGRFASEAGDGTTPDLPTRNIALETIDPDGTLLDLPAHSVGRLLATIQNCATATTLFLYQCPPLHDLNPFSDQLHAADLSEWYPDPNQEPLILGDIIGHVATELKNQSALPGWEAERQAICPYATFESVEETYNNTWIITSTFLGGLLDSLLPFFRHVWSAAQFHALVSGFMTTVRMAPASQFLLPKNMYANPKLPRDFGEYLDDDDDDDDALVYFSPVDVALKPTGPRVPMYFFCSLILPIEPGAQCVVCLSEIENAFTDATTEPVTANACGRLFHAGCLDSWVNDSAVATAGKCLECRAVLCEARPRAPEEMVGEEDEYCMIWE